MEERDPSGIRGEWLRLTEGGHIRPLAELEAEAVERALAFYGGNLSEAARRLGVGRSTIYRKMRKGGA